MRCVGNSTTHALVLILVSGLAFGDDLDYSVADYGEAEVTVNGDGTIFVEYEAVTPGATYAFTLHVWVESGQAAAPFPTVDVPIEFMKLSGTDATSWFASDPEDVSFDGYGDDPDPREPGAGYTGIPGGSYESVQVSFTVPDAGLDGERLQVKVKARTQGIRHLGEGHGVIVRLAEAEETDPTDPTDPGDPPCEPMLVVDPTEIECCAVEGIENPEVHTIAVRREGCGRVTWTTMVDS